MDVLAQPAGSLSKRKKTSGPAVPRRYSLTLLCQTDSHRWYLTQMLSLDVKKEEVKHQKMVVTDYTKEKPSQVPGPRKCMDEKEEKRFSIPNNYPEPNE